MSSPYFEILQSGVNSFPTTCEQLARLLGCVLEDRVMKTELAKQSALSVAPATEQKLRQANAQTQPKGTSSFVSYLGSDGVSIALVVSTDEHGVRALSRRVHFDPN